MQLQMIGPTTFISVRLSTCCAAGCAHMRVRVMCSWYNSELIVLRRFMLYYRYGVRWGDIMNTDDEDS